MDVGSNLICSPELEGTELVLDSLDTLGLVVADEIAETRIGTEQEVERRGECTMDGQGATKRGRIGRTNDIQKNKRDAKGRDQIQ
jgi:hypothetical protein